MEVASIMHLFVSLVILVKAGCLFLETAGQQQVREPLNYSLLLKQVSQHTTATGCEEEDTPATPHYISAAQFSSAGRRMLLSIRC